MGAGKTPDEWDALKEKWQAKFNNNGHGNSNSLSIEAQLLPTPVSRDSKGVTLHHKHRGVVSGLPDVTGWGKYAPAIARWAEVINRPAPGPTDDQKRLNPALVEWMMGYPEGWTEGVSRTGQLKALGNAIVPHQAAAAWGHLLGFNVATEAGGGNLLPTPTTHTYKESGICRDWGSDLTHALTCPHLKHPTATDPDITGPADRISGQ